jgi:adenylate cyclase
MMPEYGGEEVKAIGDALLVRFGDAEQALHLASRLVNDYAVRHGGLGVRVGVHTGTAVERDGDWFGAAVNVAARVADVAEPGEVLVTAETREAAPAFVTLEPRGRREFKNVREPVELFAIAAEPGEVAHGLPVDPVCRMSVDPRRCDHRREHGGHEYHFCSEGCAAAFDAEPARYATAVRRRPSRRISDEARERAQRRLSRAFVEGRLTQEELEERTGLLSRARTRADLRAVTEGLPRHRRRRRGWGWLGPPRG